MDPLWRQTAVVPIVSTVAMGVVVSAAMSVMGVMVGVSSAGGPRGQEHLEFFKQKFKRRADGFTRRSTESF